MNTLNIASYKFVSIPANDLPEIKLNLSDTARRLNLKGTILLSAEGINQCVAGSADAIAAFKTALEKISFFKDLTYKESWSPKQPFGRMLVKIKSDIIPFNAENIRPEQAAAPHLPPAEFKKWYDEKRDMIVLDTRNDYEIRIGKFANAIDLNLRHFRDFPQVAAEKLSAYKDKTIVTYCTGGIRCEKVAAWMLQAGFENVYQLEGGILNYFEKCAGAHYEGECFVFDDRIAVDAQLNAIHAPLCGQCQAPLTIAERGARQTLCTPCDEK